LFREAEELYERALARLPGGGAALAPDPERLAVLLGLGAAAEGRGNLPRAEQALVEALETAARLGEPASLASARYLLGLVETRRGSYTIAREHFDLALPQARQSGDDAVLANVLSGLAEASFRGGDIDNAFLAALECIDLARAQGNDTLLAAVQNRLATVYWMHGETVAAREQFDEALALARRIGLRRVEGAVLANLGMLASTERKWSEAVSCWTAGLGIHRELSEISGINITACNLAVGYIRLGDLEKALPLIQESLQAALGMQSTSGRLRAVLGWGEYQLAQGHTRQGFTLLGLTRWHPSSAADNVVAVNLGTDYWMERLRLTRSQVAALLEEGKKLDLDAVVKEISQS
jgi:tetratricopeptide (TPR) repeat protein